MPPPRRQSPPSSSCFSEIGPSHRSSRSTEGRNTEVGGYFLSNEDVNYLVVNIENGEVGFSTVFHEYSHFLIGNSLGQIPVWASEGLAQFYESFEERDSGRVALFRRYSAQHNMDWMLMAAQGFQESRLDHNARSRVTATLATRTKNSGSPARRVPSC